MKFTIDRSKWRCGDFFEDSHGKGGTYLLNEDGYMCCLGMVSEQLGLPKKALLNASTPAKLELEQENILAYLNSIGRYNSTDLAVNAMRMNDNRLRRGEREESLTELFKEHGHELVFINDYTEVTAYEV